MALTCPDGSFKLVTKAGRVEKNAPDGHTSTIICIKWAKIVLILKLKRIW
jgi:hypothetical protein